MSEEKDRVDGTADETKAETKSSDHYTEDTYEKVCFMCRRPESKAGKMITLPGNINICPDCMQKSFDTMNQNPGQINEMMNNMNNMPNIGMFDLSGLSNQIPNRQRVKKKEEKKKTKEKLCMKHAILKMERMTSLSDIMKRLINWNCGLFLKKEMCLKK